MKVKRLRRPKVKPNTLELYWGNIDGGREVCGNFGDGCEKADLYYLFQRLCNEWYGPGSCEPRTSPVQELIDRGYDITTLKFSIEKTV